jgi:DNA polymerase III subunit delta'
MTSIVGHHRILTLLERTVAQGRPAHAYLFSGREGVGKRLVAKYFASMLNCLRPGEDSSQTCSSCRRTEAEQHPDFIMERPDRGMIRIERIRNIRSSFQYSPIEGSFRICVIDDAHTMNRSAQNALLKTLEEPPSGRVLVLVSAKPSLLLPTVRSRCRRIRFGPIPLEPLAGLLTARGVAADRAPVLAAMSAGSMSRALEMNQSNFLDLREKVVAVLTETSGHGIRDHMAFSAEISKDRRTASEALDIGLTWIRDMVLAACGCDLSGAIHRDFLDRIGGTTQHLNSEQLFAVYDELVRASELIEAEINVNRNLVTDVMLLRIARIISGPTMGVAAPPG